MLHPSPTYLQHTVIGIGSSSPGLISVGIVIVNTLLDGKGKERRVTHEAARILTGYVLGLQIREVVEGEEVTEVRYIRWVALLRVV